MRGLQRTRQRKKEFCFRGNPYFVVRQQRRLRKGDRSRVKSTMPPSLRREYMLQDTCLNQILSKVFKKWTGFSYDKN